MRSLFLELNEIVKLLLLRFDMTNIGAIKTQKQTKRVGFLEKRPMILRKPTSGKFVLKTENKLFTFEKDCFFWGNSL